MENGERAPGAGPRIGPGLLQRMAATALGQGGLIRCPYPGGPAESIELRAEELPLQCGEQAGIDELSALAWQSRGEGLFDGELLGVFAMASDAASMRWRCCKIPYRTFLAAERIARRFPTASFPLAVGVHALMVAGEQALMLLLDDGKLSVPGGAVDWRDYAETVQAGAGQHVLASAVLREIREETGLDLGLPDVVVTGVYVGATPLHLAVMALIRCGQPPEEWMRACRGERPDSREGIRGLRMVRLKDLMQRPQGLSLAARTSLRPLVDRDRP